MTDSLVYVGSWRVTAANVKLVEIAGNLSVVCALSAVTCWSLTFDTCRERSLVLHTPDYSPMGMACSTLWEQRVFPRRQLFFFAVDCPIRFQFVSTPELL